MRNSFFSENAFPFAIMITLIAMPLAATLFVACSGPDTPEEKAAAEARFIEFQKEELAIISPRPGVECYILRGYGPGAPRGMSCVTLPVTVGQ